MKSMRYLFFIPALFVPVLLVTAQTPAPSKFATSAPAKKTATAAPVKNFKESGSPNAPVRIEIYTDYECPACRDLYMNALPSINSDFVATGKVQLLHRDYPLPQHQYSKLATRYANAAGEIGKYEVVANQLFVTQPQWAADGKVDGVVAKVLSPAEMEKVRGLVKNDTHLDDSVTADVAMGTNVDHLSQTPTIVVVSKGKRDVIGGMPPYIVFKQFVNQKLK